MLRSLDPVYQIFLQEVLLWGLLGIVFGVLMTLLSLFLFPKIGLLDFPERYGLSRKKIPYPGGLILIILLPLLLLIDVSLLPVILGGGLIGVISFIDDRHPLPALFRLVFYIGVASLVWWMGVSVNFISSPFAEDNIWDIDSKLLSLGITVFWILLLQQALNWFDGIKGLSVGVSGIGFLILGLLGLVKPELFFDLNQSSTTIAQFFLAGFCLASFFFYLRGKILLGDSGAQVLGFLLATMSLISGAKIATTLLVLSLPCIDLLAVIVRRVFIEKGSPMKGDQKHIHHNLSRKIGEIKTTFFLLSLSFLLGILSLFTSSVTKFISLTIVGILLLLFTFWILKKESA